MINALLRTAVSALLALRYRVRVRGIDDVAARGTRGILFLPNHPALIDPIIVAAALHRRFAPHFLADQDQIDRPVIRWLARRIGARPLPDLGKYGAAARARTEQALAECAADLRRGDCVVLYPAGHIAHGALEDLGAASGAETLLRQAPEARVVLIRTRGLWGSGFSWARNGAQPTVLPILRRGIRGLLLSALLFAPRREVALELVEPADLPRHAGREALNRYLERFYNADPPRNTYVPYSVWERGGPRAMPEPAPPPDTADVSAVPTAVREAVLDHLRGAAGVAAVSERTHLARDLGMDSLALVDLAAWVEAEFHVAIGAVETLRTAGDVMRAACGASASLPAEVPPPHRCWFRNHGEARLTMPAGATVAEVFLRRAAGRPGQAIVADAASGVRTYRDLVAGILALRGTLAAMPGENVGIMLPASVGADLVYLAVLFAGKTPVMVNWTMGPHPLRHALDRAGVQRILTAEALVKRLDGQGLDLGPLDERFIFLERVRQALPPRVKLAAWLRVRLSWRSLRNARIRPTAAILFTSGSETAPKAVPLTHANILTNIRDVTGVIAIRESDRLVGLLPPFHVFGLGETVILPLCLGLPTVYHPNPTDGAALTQIIKAYRATLLMGTPTFLGGIARAAAGPLPTLRLAVTGAEKCSERVYAQVAEVCPNARILEGYGITECSPIVAVNPVERPKPFTIGRALPSVEYAIVDEESRRRAAAGQAGMLLVRGPSIFGGYLAPAPTPHAALPQGFVEFEGRTWYRTGDLVSEDAEGYLTFRGRLKRFVKLGGEMVSLPAIEAALEPLDPAAGAQGPLLAVEATDDDPPEIVLFTALPLDRETVNRRLREAGLPPLYNVKKALRLDAIPLLGSGKTDYRALKQMLSVAK